jgi:hypothetical protein
MSDEYSDEILEETPTRVTRVLTALARSSVIRTLMQRGGLTDEDVTEGRTLLLRCLAQPSSTPTTDTDDARRRREALATLDAWDEPNFARYRAALRRHYPAAERYVFNGLTAGSGPAAVQAVATFLQRVGEVEAGRAEGINRTVGRMVTTLLAQRGLDAAERRRLNALVTEALSPADALPAAEVDDTARREALVALRGWYEEWSTVARAEVKRRDHLILLGLARRSAAKTKAPPAP